MSTKRSSLLDGIKLLFPAGYLDYSGYQARLRPTRSRSRKLSRSFEQPPCQAADLFAIASFLLHRSGGYHHISPSVEGAAATRSLPITAADRTQWQAAGKEWRGDGASVLPAPPSELLSAWAELMRFRDNPLFLSSPPRSKPRPWWHAAMALMAVAMRRRERRSPATPPASFRPGSARRAIR